MERELPDDLLVFYHPQTLREICALRHYLLLQDQNHLSDSIDDWIRMVALNRLTGHSSGFFSRILHAPQPGCIGRFSEAHQYSTSSIPSYS